MTPHTFGVPRGVSLVEFLIGVALSAIVLAALGQAFLGSKITFQLNRGFSTLQDNSRYSLQSLETRIRMAGYQDRSVGAGPIPNFLEATPDNNDAITVRFGTGTNTSVTDCAGDRAPPHSRVDITYALTGVGELICTSEAQPEGAKVTQVVASGLDQLRIQYAVDDNDDGIVDRTIRNPVAGSESAIVRVELCLVVSSGTVTDALAHTHYDCDGVQKSTSDGLMRRRFTSTVTLRNHR